MRQTFRGFFLALFLASCASEPAPVSTVIPSPTATIPAHAPEIRFGLIGGLQDVNVWALFDEQGASYNDYALRSEYWPRLYHLAPPEFKFEPLAANGSPSPVVQEGEFYTSIVKLRPDLKWTDGAPFSARDVSFTVNAALAFELGYDWSAYYPGAYLAKAEAIDDVTVKYYFKQKPNMGVWQYGALQGFILQQTYWSSKIENAQSLLPADELRAQIDAARTYIDKVQFAVNDLTPRITALKLNGKGDTQMEGELRKRTEELVFAQNNLNKLLDEYSSKIRAAQNELYALDDADEPTLGVWMSASQTNDIWTNKANPDFPFGAPNFDRIVYVSYKDEQAALDAFKNKEINSVLVPGGISSDLENAKLNPTTSARFIVINPARADLADPPLRAALNCMVDRKALAGQVLGNYAAPLDSFVIGEWRKSSLDPCASLDDKARIEMAVKLLKDAGYSWKDEPAAGQEGRGLTLPNGETLAHVTLLASAKADDPIRFAAAKYFAERAQLLGVSFSTESVEAKDLTYAAFSSHHYDMALIGWRLSAYPGYLCGWFGAQGQFDYGSDRLHSRCDALGIESDFESALRDVMDIQAILAEDLPFIPLYLNEARDIYQGIQYPFDEVLGGLNELYGVPSLAAPAQ